MRTFFFYFCLCCSAFGQGLPPSTTWFARCDDTNTGSGFAVNDTGWGDVDYYLATHRKFSPYLDTPPPFSYFTNWSWTTNLPLPSFGSGSVIDTNGVWLELTNTAFETRNFFSNHVVTVQHVVAFTLVVHGLKIGSQFNVYANSDLGSTNWFDPFYQSLTFDSDPAVVSGSIVGDETLEKYFFRVRGVPKTVPVVVPAVGVLACGVRLGFLFWQAFKG